MSGIWYTAITKSDPSFGNEWVKYQNWAKIPQLRERISLDHTLRPKELWDLIDTDWAHNVRHNYLIAFFWDLDYLLKRFENNRDKVNILAVCFEPSFEVKDSFKDRRFEFQGYDLVEPGDSSVISGYVRLDKAFKISDISEVGLFNTYTFAREVQKLLDQHYTQEIQHCDLWAIWKMIE
jgi:hypothetical protein